MSTRYCIPILFLLLLAGQAVAQPEQSAKKPADPLDGPPLVTAAGWAIADGRTGQFLWGLNEASVRQIASTTKIMTAYLVLQLAERDKAVLDQVATISERADKTGGTSADVRAGEHIAVRDLLYGLLLPSGNDAAVALAEHFGHAFAAEKPSATTNDERLAAFVEQMNRTAASLGMEQTKYFDPHGNSANRSTPLDLLKLTYAAMQNPLFRQYVQTRRHQCQFATPAGQRDVSWTNTNQCLEIDGFDGVKTGTTSGAGCCLVSSCRRGDDHLLLVVLGSTSREGRFIDTRNLVRWAWREREPGSPKRESGR